MNNEPVAIRYDFDGYGYQYIDSGSGSDWQTRVQGEPLYTYPVKELTDEEIMKIANEVFKDYKNWHHYQLDFARAILRKVQEK